VRNKLQIYILKPVKGFPPPKNSSPIELPMQHSWLSSNFLYQRANFMQKFKRPLFWVTSAPLLLYKGGVKLLVPWHGTQICSRDFVLVLDPPTCSQSKSR